MLRTRQAPGGAGEISTGRINAGEAA